ncbi:hypothetical protein [Hymenobacter convexus]|uniref:hypothetical protein n=1 Tax=Hymenobacter sp. CA1UV-4 TaxID=3063782 RepID=UPI0027140DEA|nr:hypothetical protein [Hymenobacter sp. CA1UV-4]MDO7853174.1 hypothetical protein [Hymenobacter sp. CA1UV-4]
MSTGSTAWPGMFTPPAELLEWLSTQRPQDRVGQKAVVTLRWLVHAELERRGPDPPPGRADFPPDDGPRAD